MLKDWSINTRNNVITRKNSQGKLKYQGASLIDPTTIPKVLKWTNVSELYSETSTDQNNNEKLSLSYKSK